eukprot:COSAG06_NODE_6779_length_2786_cov_31.443617_1_plen_163_part_00
MRLQIRGRVHFRVAFSPSELIAPPAQRLALVWCDGSSTIMLTHAKLRNIHSHEHTAALKSHTLMIHSHSITPPGTGSPAQGSAGAPLRPAASRPPPSSVHRHHSFQGRSASRDFPPQAAEVHSSAAVTCPTPASLSAQGQTRSAAVCPCHCRAKARLYRRQQ